MRNPWSELPNKDPFVLAEDAEMIHRFNRTAQEAARIQLEVLPEPFLGNPAAAVVLLALNPGFDPEDRLLHADPTFAELSRNNLEHRASACPFYLLDERISGPGQRWWKSRLRPILELIPYDLATKQILCIEYFGYHSKKFAHEKLRLPSQLYGFHLVREAIARGSVIVVTRGRRVWLDSVQELRTYPYFKLQSVQNTTISARNCPEGFPVIIERLQRLS